MKRYDKQYIGGKWVEGTGSTTLTNTDPFTGEALYSYQGAGLSDVDAAYAAAKKAQKEWEHFLPDEKVQVFEQAIGNLTVLEDEVHEVLQKEGGFVCVKRDYEFQTVLSFLRTCRKFPEMMAGKTLPSNIPGKENYVFRVPKGVVCVIPPWNVPFVLAARSVIPAIAAGNGVVLKPSAETPASALLLAKVFEGTGMPDGLLNVVIGPSSVIGDAVVKHPVPQIVSFTGSTPVGRRIGKTAGESLKEVSLELGGNNVMIVTADADLDAAASAAVFGAYNNQGQVCMAINRILIIDSVYDAFTALLVDKVSALKVGDPADPEVFIGPIINRKQAAGIEKIVDGTLKQGAHAALEGHTEGNVIYPWILTEVTNDMPSASQEVFGPVVSLLRVKDEEEAIAIANDTEYGLSGSVFTKDLYHGIRIAKRLETGMVHINDQSINDEPHCMFGGVKSSGIGRFNDEWVLEKFTTDRWISVQTSRRF